MRKISVLHASESFGWSGGAAQLLFLAGGLKKRGHDNFIACPDGGDLWKKASAKGFAPYPFRPKRDYHFTEGLKLARLADSLDADVLHAHHPKAHTMCLVAKIFSKRKPALVVSRRVSHPLSASFFSRLKYLNRRVDGYIAVAGAVKKMLADYGVPPEKLEVVYSGTDEKVFYPKSPSAEILKELSLSGREKIVGLIGNFSKDKGQRLLLAAAARLKDEFPEMFLLFAGRGTDSPEMKKAAESSGFPPERARFMGLRNDVQEIISILALSVNCSVKGEALSGSMREAMAMGRPVVASDIAGNRELVSDGETGRLFPPGDAGALAAAVSSALSDYGSSLRMASAGVEKVRRGFTVDSMVDNTLRCYAKFLNFKV